MEEDTGVQNKAAFPEPPPLYKLYQHTQEDNIDEALWTPPKPIEGSTFLKFGKPHSVSILPFVLIIVE